MLKKDLKILEEKIHEIDALRPIDFLSQIVSSIQPDVELSDQEYSKLEKDFNTNLNTLIKTYESKGISQKMIGLSLYSYLIQYLRKVAIFSYADELGIDPILFKNQMSFLFKGKL
jgi:hypothetical protein